MKRVTLITDGSCLSNPDGPGGWACIVRHRGNDTVLRGSEQATTNNRMELAAAIAGLASLTSRSEVTVVTDSQYLSKGITQWLASWKRKGWKTGNGSPVKNRDLWMQLDALVKQHDVTWTWTRGHAGHADNETVDRIAREMAEYARDAEKAAESACN